VGPRRTLAPNDFVVELGATDHERLEPYADTLGGELATMMREYAGEQGYSYVGPVQVHFERTDELDTGVFRVRSDVIRGLVEADAGDTGAADRTDLPRLVVAPGTAAESTYVLKRSVTVIGRGEGSGLQLPDPGASRRHAELRRDQDQVTLVDLGSTNGTLVNGHRVDRVVLGEGDTILIGQTTLAFHGAG
jgi:hypothetical protein